MKKLSSACVLTISLAVLWLPGCNEPDTIMNNIVGPGGSIYGRVVPPKQGTEVAAWQAEKIQSTLVDDEGFFALTDLPAGLYNVLITAPDGTGNERLGISVDRTRNAPLGNVVLLDPTAQPPISFSLSDGDSSVSLSTTFEVRSEEELDLSSLVTGIIIDPPLAGEWRQYYQGSYYLYRYHRATDLTSNTDYTLTLTTAVRFMAGESLDEALSWSFRTIDFELLDATFTSQGTDIAPLFSGRLVTIRFNMEVGEFETASVFRTEPPLLLVAVDYYDPRRVQLDVLGGLLADTEYRLIIDASLEDLNGNALGAEETLHFNTAPARITQFRASGNSSSGPIPPGTDLSSTIVINSRIDLDAFNAAASFNPPVDGVWLETQFREGGSSPGHYLKYFTITALSLVPEQQYVFTIPANTSLGNGVMFDEEFREVFEVDAVKVTSVSPPNASRSHYPTSYLQVYFNIPMAHAETESAFTLQAWGGASVAGTFTWSSDSKRLQFRPTVALAYDSAYTFEVSTAAKSQGGVLLKEATSTPFRTRTQ